MHVFMMYSPTYPTEFDTVAFSHFRVLCREPDKKILENNFKLEGMIIFFFVFFTCT